MQRCQNEIFQPVAIPYLLNLGPNSILEVNQVFPLQTSIIQSTKQHRTRVNGREIWQVVKWAQPTFSALLLIPQTHVPYICGPF